MIKMWQAGLVIIPTACIYWFLVYNAGSSANYVLGGALLWALIIACTILILNKIESLKPKDKDKEGKDKTATE